MNKKSSVMLSLVLVLLSIGVVALPPAASITPFVSLNPSGAPRVSLSGKSSWNRFIQVFDGTFSAQLGPVASPSDSGSVYVSPIRVPLFSLTASNIRFWVYHDNNKYLQPVVDMVLSNGRRMEGEAIDTTASVPVGGVPVSSIQCEGSDSTDRVTGCLGYPSSNAWIQMQPVNEWYSSFAGIDLAIPASFGINTPKTLAQWAALPAVAGVGGSPVFNTLFVVQIQIAYRAPAVNTFDGCAGACVASLSDSTCYVDMLSINGITYRIEPDSASTA